MKNFKNVKNRVDEIILIYPKNRNISKLNDSLTQNKIGGAVTITSYTSSSNMYTAPSDGYIWAISSSNSGVITIHLYGSTGTNYTYFQVPYSSGARLLYVRKGMRFYVGNSTGTVDARFIPLTS